MLKLGSVLNLMVSSRVAICWSMVVISLLRLQCCFSCYAMVELI